MVPEEERELILRIIKYVKKHHRVTLSQISRELDLDQTDHNYLLMSLAKRMGEKENPNHIVSFVSRPVSNKAEDYKEDEYQLLPTAIFSYIDYLEIKEAREHAQNANNQSMTALYLSLAAIGISILFGIASLMIGFLQLYFDHFKKN